MTAVTKSVWSTIDWWDMDAEDPRRFHKGFRSWLYYAQPVMTRNGKTYQPREFRAGTREAAERIIRQSPEGRGHIEKWSERTNRRISVAEVTP